MKINMERLRRLEQLREMRHLPSQERLDEQKILFRQLLKAPGANLVSLIREISAAYRRREYVDERKNAALALITTCREYNLLDQLSLCWKIDEERKLKRAHWVALALLEACETFFLGHEELEPWFLPLVRLTRELVSYAQYGFICDPGAGITVRQNERYALNLMHRCQNLAAALGALQTKAATVGGIKATVTYLRNTRRVVKFEQEAARTRRARIHDLKVVLETKRLASRYGATPVLSPDLYKHGRNSRSSLPS